jgi:flagellar basal-body rod protein FlgC
MGMHITQANSPVDIATSSLQANNLRLKVIANNIANANVTSPDHKPYVRKDVTVSTRIDQLAGVRLSDVVEDHSTESRPVYDPQHPHADENGFVHYPNVDVPKELMNLMLASRHYQASVAIIKRQSEVSEASLELLR